MSRTTRRNKGRQLAGNEIFHRDIQWSRYNEGTKRYIRQNGVRSSYRIDLVLAICQNNLENFSLDIGSKKYKKAWSWGV